MDTSFSASFINPFFTEESDSTESDVLDPWVFAKDRPPSPVWPSETPPDYDPADSPLWEKFLSYRCPSHERVSQISKPIFKSRKRDKCPVKFCSSTCVPRDMRRHLCEVHLIPKNEIELRLPKLKKKRMEFPCSFDGCKSKYADIRALQKHMAKHLSEIEKNRNFDCDKSKPKR